MLIGFKFILIRGIQTYRFVETSVKLDFGMKLDIVVLKKMRKFHVDTRLV